MIPNYKTKEGRKIEFNKLIGTKEFSNKILVIGCGSIGPVILMVMLKLIKLDPSKITIIEKNPIKLNKLSHPIYQPVKKINMELKKENIEDTFINKLGLGQDDIIVDASYEINTNFLFDICSRYGISYINSAIEVWSDEPNMTNVDFTFHSRYESMEKQNAQIPIKRNNFIISMGCNPGNVNIWTYYALDKINKLTKQNHIYKSYAELAQKMGLQVIHVSEKDTQITNQPKRKGEYVNTWSEDATSWYDEAFSEQEINWGTHEKYIPEYNKELSNQHQYILDGNGCENFALTYTGLNKNVMGMLIRHEECYSMSKRLTIRDSNGKIIYKPSSYYVYRPCDSCFLSIQEVRENNGTYQPVKRLMTKDIVEGRDELGVTLFFSNSDIFWFGSLLDIEEVRELFNHEFDELVNATGLQVVAGYLGGVYYLIDNIKAKKYHGLRFPDDLPIKEFVKVTRPLLGPLGLIKVKDWKIEPSDKTNLWQFKDFLVN